MVKKKVVKKSSSKLDLLRRKLELEQELLENKKGDTKKIEKLKAQMDAHDESSDEPEEVKESDVEKDQVKEIIEQVQEQQPSPMVSVAKKSSLKARINQYQNVIKKVRSEVSKVVVGQQESVTAMLRALIADGHVLVEGVPGIAKTTLIRTLAQTTGCSFGRIQFTPDLLPTDIIGISTYQEGRGFYTLKGPIFNNFILADEINRAPPKVQSALLEAMAEKQATIAKSSFTLPSPFFTMATQNPLENVGTYVLPEAQVDRFLFKLFMGYPTIDEEQSILRTNISVNNFENYQVKPILNPEAITQIQEDAKQIYVDKKVEKYIVKITDATRFPKKYKVPSGKYVDFGASPRGSIGLFIAARAQALISGQHFVTPQHVKTVAMDVLRHRVILSYEGQAEGVKSEDVIKEILKKVPVP